MLIAIISKTYDRVDSTQEEQALKEKCSIISDVRDFPMYKYFKKQGKPCEFLFIAMSDEIQERRRKRDVDQYDIYEALLEIKDQ